MRNKTHLFLSAAAVTLSLSLPCLAQSAMPAGNTDATGSPVSQNAQPTPRAERQAMRMVPATAALDQALDADKVADGYQFRATLASKVELDNGMVLSKGTKLIGQVATDDLNLAGTSKLALRFTEAVMKDGTQLPIKATIVGTYKYDSESFSEASPAPGKQMPNNWNDGTLAVDQIGVEKDVDLHSRIASRNSGVFVSGNNHVVKLPANTELALALAARKPAAPVAGE